MINSKKFLISLAIPVIVLFMIFTTALAAPGAGILYTETDIGGGLWQYDYAFQNTSDSGDYLYSVYLYFTQETLFTGTLLATGWDGIVWDGNTWPTTFTDTYSTDPGYDIAAGNSLGGFSFTVDYQAGDIAYDAFFSGDQMISGTTSLVPEPVSSTLFVIGGAVLGFRRFMKRKAV
jgi:hypothetical protein